MLPPGARALHAAWQTQWEHGRARPGLRTKRVFNSTESGRCKLRWGFHWLRMCVRTALLFLSMP
eukprot:6492811-Alexandrium_andersonii.AAC.1